MTISNLRKGYALVKFLIMFSLVILGTLPLASNKTYAATGYYVDCSAGSNGSGTQASPWNALSSVNAVTFSPGDTINFKKGTACTGQLKPQGSGSSGSPITIDAYGTGAAPLINGNGVIEAAIYLLNVSHWTVQNLEVTNDAATEDLRSGVLVQVTDNNFYSGITIQNLNIHHVKGLSDRTIVGRYSSAGITVRVPRDTETATGTVSNVLINNNSIHDLTCGGIATGGGTWGGLPRNYIGNMVVQNNTIVGAAADPIFIGAADAPLIQNNVAYDTGFNAVNAQVLAQMWAAASNNPTFQYNEAARIINTNDSQAWDCDWGISGLCTYQYNYGHDNIGGFFLNCTGCVKTNKSMIQVLRYNINQGSARTVNSGQGTDQWIHNNTFFSAGHSLSNMAFTNNSHIIDNIFVGPAISALPTWSGIEYDYNLYSGFTGPASDTHAIHGDPMFVNPGSAGDGRNTVDGYKLLAGSPALASGRVMTNTGGKDYWGNTVDEVNSPNIGAYNAPGISGGKQNGIVDGAVYKLVNANSNKVLGIYGAQTGNGANAVQWTDIGSADQKWKIVALSNGYYKLVNQNSLKVLGIYGGGTGSGSNAVQWDDTGSADQSWLLVKKANGKYTIYNRNSGKVLGISGMAVTDGANAVQWDDNGTLDHEWTLVKLN